MKPSGSLKKTVIVGVVVIAVVAIAAVWLLRPKPKKIAVIDDLPIWELDNGTTVYRELEFDGQKLTKNIVLENVAEGTKIYDTIPKEIAASAKDLKFSVEPEIVQDDPVVLWSTCKTNCPKDKGFLDMTKTLAAGIITTVRDAGLNYFTDVCSTKTAKDWIKSAGYKEGEFFGCSQYIRYMEKTVAERQTAEWQNKLEQGKIKNTYEPTANEYQGIRTSAKQVIQTQKAATSPSPTAPTPKKQTQPAPAKKAGPCDYCGTIKNSSNRSGVLLCRSNGTGCTECNTDADCPSTHFCSNGAGCFMRESEILKRAK